MRATTTPFRLDVENDTAILTLHAALDRAQLGVIRRRCAELAPHVVALRLDLRALGVMSAEDGIVVRSILHAWRSLRGGSFQLSTSHLVATCRQVDAPAPLWADRLRGDAGRTLPVAYPAYRAPTSRAAVGA